MSSEVLWIQWCLFTVPQVADLRLTRALLTRCMVYLNPTTASAIASTWVPSLLEQLCLPFCTLNSVPMVLSKQCPLFTYPLLRLPLAVIVVCEMLTFIWFLICCSFVLKLFASVCAACHGCSSQARFYAQEGRLEAIALHIFLAILSIESLLFGDFSLDFDEYNRSLCVINAVLLYH